MESIEAAIGFIGGPGRALVLLGFFFGIVVLERLWALRRSPNYSDADALCSIGLFFVAVVLNLGVVYLVPLALYALVFDNFRVIETMPIWAAIPIAVVVHDFAYYWDHRLAHRIGLLWAFHSIHHSSNEFNHSTAARTFVLDGQLKVFFAMPAALLGVDPVIYIGVVVLCNLYGIWNHGSWVPRNAWLSRVLITPETHKVHHGTQSHYIDRNFAEVTVIFDRLFGTFMPIKEEPEVGLVNRVDDNNPLTAQFVGLRQLKARMDRADSWGDKLAYLWRPPEWSHDGAPCPHEASADEGRLAAGATP